MGIIIVLQAEERCGNDVGVHHGMAGRDKGEHCRSLHPPFYVAGIDDSFRSERAGYLFETFDAFHVRSH